MGHIKLHVWTIWVFLHVVYLQRLTKDLWLIALVLSKIVKRPEQMDQFCARSVQTHAHQHILLIRHKDFNTLIRKL